jgi:hypothetical protein
MQNAEAFYCLTWHGTILTRDQLGMPFLHESLDSGIPPNAARFTLHCTSAGSQIGITARLLPGDAQAPEPANPPAFTVFANGAGRAAYLHLGKKFAHVPAPHGSLHAIAKPGQFAVFIFVPAQELTDLLFIRANQWLTAANTLIKHGETGFSAGHIFRFGAIECDLRFGPCFTGADLTEITVLRDGWKIAGQLRLFRPLIFQAAFGRPHVFEQLRLSLRSLAEFGAYTGDIHVISDRPEAYVAQFIPPQLHGRLTVQNLTGMDYWDFCLARLRLPEWPGAAAFQPFLYADTDILFDRPIEPLLTAIAAAGQICAAPEPFSKLSTAPATGAPLFKAAGVETGEAGGFNSGCQGFPNLATMSKFTRLTLHIAESVRAFQPGGVSIYADQPFANYTAHMTETVNTECIGAAMRFTFDPLSAAPADRAGMVHFCLPGAPKETRHAVMQAYLEALAAADAMPAPNPLPAAAE